MFSQSKSAPRLPACRHLRSKGMFVSGRLDPEHDESEASDANCWCMITQKMLGPDDGLVQRRACVEGRDCYIAIL